MLVTAQASLPLPIWRFPSLQQGLLSRRRVYFDNACLTPVPGEVAAAVSEYYSQAPGCPVRNSSNRSGELGERILEARDSVRSFLNAKFPDEIVFTPNTTFGINLLSGAFLYRPGKVLLTDLEHNSNRLPWLAHDRLELPWPPGEPFPFDAYSRALQQNIKLVSITARSHVTGESPPVNDLVREAAIAGVPVHLDAAQAFASGELDVTASGADFVSFSLPKAYGPTGLGGLYLRRTWRGRLEPTYAGAGTVDDHFGEASEWTDGAPRFEYGLQNYAAIYAVPVAIRLLAGLRPRVTRDHFAELNGFLRTELRRIPGVCLVGPRDPVNSHHVCSFYVRGADPKRLASLLDMAGNFQVRAGRLCAHHWFHKYEVPEVIRVSFGLHNSLEEVEAYARLFGNILRHYL
jgi:selenocysteine lyase/cysteine desulfurase